MNQSLENGLGRGGPQQTSIAVSRKKTRIEIRARVTCAEPAIDITASMADEQAGQDGKRTNSFYRTDQV